MPCKKLGKLKKMFEAELITEQEYAAKKQEILDKMNGTLSKLFGPSSCQYQPFSIL